MMTTDDFSKKQIIFVLCKDGERLAIQNDNLIVKDKEGKIKLQCTCYRVFLVYVVGACSLTTVLIQKAKQFGFFIALMTTGFRLYDVIGAQKDGNTLLHKKQYEYSKLDIAKHIVKNKIDNQLSNLSAIRCKSDSINEAITKISEYYEKVGEVDNLNELLAFEGLSSKVYFKNHFNNILWLGRKPRIKADIVNSVLDIAYSLLFAFIDSLLECFGFDTYRGVMHTQFYMRKSLVCDLVEPFRAMMDKQVKKSYNLKQISDKDFLLQNKQYRLKWEKSTEYISFLMKPIVDNKDLIFVYIQNYYRAFMKGESADKFPLFNHT